MSEQELVSIRRRTKTALEKAKADGRKLGAPRRLSEEQEAEAIEMVASGISQRHVAKSFGVSPATAIGRQLILPEPAIMVDAGQLEGTKRYPK